MSFPRCTYHDMVVAQYRLLTEHLGVDHLRLVRGTSMGGMHPLIFLVSSPLQWQKEAPTRGQAETFLEARIRRHAVNMDANDLIYQFDSSRDYDPSPHLERIVALLMAINSADDQVNPPELGILERETQRVPRGRLLLLPISDRTRGHGTHSIPAIWGPYLEGLLADSEPTD